MSTLGSEDEATHDANLVDWQTFCLAYYEPILATLRFMQVPEEDVYERAHAFLLKAAEKNFLETFHAHQEREARAGRRARFRTYLYRSLQNHVHDAYRKEVLRSRERGMAPGETEAVASGLDRALDPDALYALDVLHQALQALRRHCERTGKSHYWVFFEETFLAEEIRGRRARSRDELLQAYPGVSPQSFDNALTTAKRAFRRFVHEVIPRGLRDDVSPAERFEEWMQILRDSSSSQFNLLHLAYRVTPLLADDGGQADSAALVIDDRAKDCRVCAYEEPPLVPSDDEMSIFLSFRLELPLTESLDAAEFRKFIPPSSPLWPFHRGRARREALAPRPVSLLTLVDPTPAEAEGLARADLVGLLTRLKTFAKQLRRRPDHSVPEVFAQLVYTLANVLALVRCGVNLHTIGADALRGNIDWFLGQSWLDDRLRTLFSTGQAALADLHGADPPPRSDG